MLCWSLLTTSFGRDVIYRQDSGTSLVSEGGMSNGRPMDVHWTGGLDRTVGQAWSVMGGCPMMVGCPMDVPWTSIGQVDWTGQWDKPGQ